jgi:hypothetical protein
MAADKVVMLFKKMVIFGVCSRGIKNIQINSYTMVCIGQEILFRNIIKHATVTVLTKRI